jgi:hypothetical protein
MGIDIWNTSHTSALALNSRLNDVAQFQMVFCLLDYITFK